LCLLLLTGTDWYIDFERYIEICVNMSIIYIEMCIHLYSYLFEMCAIQHIIFTEKYGVSNVISKYSAIYRRLSKV